MHEFELIAIPKQSHRGRRILVMPILLVIAIALCRSTSAPASTEPDPVILSIAVSQTLAAMPSFTPLPSTTPSPVPSPTPSPLSSATETPLPTSTATRSFEGQAEICQPRVFSGVQHCSWGAVQILRVDPQDPSVRFEIVLPEGRDRDGQSSECRDVNVPNSLIAGKSQGPGCHNGYGFPSETVAEMIARYPGAIAGFNADFFDFPAYSYGPLGLTVKNGVRLDGGLNDRDGREVRRSSLSISRNGDVRIGVVDRNLLPQPDQPWTWIPDADAYFSTVGGLPMLVSEGQATDLDVQCLLEEGWCPDPVRDRARTAVGKTAEGALFVAVIPEEPGITLMRLQDLMIALGAEYAINLDGGGSSQLWYNGRYLVTYLNGSLRPVVEGILIFSNLMLTPEATLAPEPILE